MIQIVCDISISTGIKSEGDSGLHVNLVEGLRISSFVGPPTGLVSVMGGQRLLVIQLELESPPWRAWWNFPVPESTRVAQTPWWRRIRLGLLSSKAESATTTPNEQSTYFSSFCSSFVEQGGKGSAQRHFLPWRFQEV